MFSDYTQTNKFMQWGRGDSVAVIMFIYRFSHLRFRSVKNLHHVLPAANINLWRNYSY